MSLSAHLGRSKPGLLTEEAFESSLASQLAKGWARTGPRESREESCPGVCMFQKVFRSFAFVVLLLKGSITLLQSARQSGILEPLAVVCARLVPTEGARVA